MTKGDDDRSPTAQRYPRDLQSLPSTKHHLTNETLHSLLASGQAQNPRWATCCHECGAGKVGFMQQPDAYEWRDRHVRERGMEHLISIGVEFELPDGRPSGWFLS